MSVLVFSTTKPCNSIAAYSHQRKTIWLQAFSIFIEISQFHLNSLHVMSLVMLTDLEVLGYNWALWDTTFTWKIIFPWKQYFCFNLHMKLFLWASLILIAEAYFASVICLIYIILMLQAFKEKFLSHSTWHFCLSFHLQNESLMNWRLLRYVMSWSCNHERRTKR